MTDTMIPPRKSPILNHCQVVYTTTTTTTWPAIATATTATTAVATDTDSERTAVQLPHLTRAALR